MACGEDGRGLVILLQPVIRVRSFRLNGSKGWSATACAKFLIVAALEFYCHFCFFINSALRCGRTEYHKRWVVDAVGRRIADRICGRGVWIRRGEGGQPRGSTVPRAREVRGRAVGPCRPWALSSNRLPPRLYGLSPIGPMRWRSPHAMRAASQWESGVTTKGEYDFSRRLVAWRRWFRRSARSSQTHSIEKGS